MFRSVIVTFCLCLCACLPARALSPVAPAPKDDARPDLNDQADRLIDDKKYEQALLLYQKMLGGKQHARPAEGAEALSISNNIAGCHFQLGRYADSERLLRKISGSLNKGAGDDYKDLKLAVQLELAQCQYNLGRYDEAIKTYQDCLRRMEGNRSCSNDLRRLAHEGLAGCYTHERRYAEAEPVLTKLAELDRQTYGDNDLNYAWSLLALSENRHKLGIDKEGRPLYEKSIWIFRRVNRDRILRSLGVTGPLPDNMLMPTPETLKYIRDKVSQNVFGKGDNPQYAQGDKVLPPTTDTTCVAAAETGPRGAWRLRSSIHTEAPGWVWMNPMVKPRAIVICVHGLGLHHRAFDSFARRIADQGFISIAFDVRGFGSYIEARGQEKLDMEGCVEDLRSVISVIRRDMPGLPIFLLGESMGGAIALRVTALHPELIDALICSVPSGARYQHAKTAMKVGVKKMTGGGNTPFNIGEQIVKQATGKGDLRESWGADPMSRLNLSPNELIEFNAFMHENPTYARKITRTPVIIFQGNDDKLVKRESTYELFESVGSPNKTLVLLGGTEHLIFESGQFRDGVALGVIGWMNAEIDVVNAVNAASAASPTPLPESGPGN